MQELRCSGCAWFAESRANLGRIEGELKAVPAWLPQALRKASQDTRSR